MDFSVENNSSNFTQGKSPKNGFLKFLREYSSRKYGMDLVEMSIKGGRAWSKLTDKQKEKYQSTPIENDERDQNNDEPGDDVDMDNVDNDNDYDYDNEVDINQGGSDACCPRRKPRRCPKPKRKCCPKPKRKSCCKPKRKPCRPKPRCRKPKPRCKPKPCCPKPKPCCPKPKPCCPESEPEPCCQNPGPITNNGYLNFLRMYRQKHCGLKPKDLVMRAARAWCRLPECKKETYRRLARQCFPKNKRSCR